MLDTIGRMVITTAACGVAAVLACTGAPVAAQAPAPAPAPAPALVPTEAPSGEGQVTGTEPEVVVAGRRPPGSAIGQVDPIAVLGQQAIRAFGAPSLSELLRRLKPLTTSNGGADPAFLLNGRRLSSLALIQSLPPEAMERVEVLPEQEAARFGYPPTVRVINFITVKRFRSMVVQGQAGTTTQGGGASQSAEVTTARIAGSRRTTLELSHFRQRPLRQDQRGIAVDLVPISSDRPGATADVGAGRYLQPLSDTIKIDGTLAQPVAPGIDGTLNLAMEATRNLRRNGLAPLPGGGEPLYLAGTSLRQRDTALTLRGNAELHGSAGRWTWDATAGYARLRGVVTSEQAVALAQAGRRDVLATYGRSLTNTATTKLTATGPLLRLPAGDLLITTDADYARSTSMGSIAADALLPAPFPVPVLRRTTTAATVSAVVPVAAASQGVLPVLGRLSLNGMAGVSRASGFDRLANIAYGVNWQPVRPLEFSASINQTQAAPALASLTGAVVSVPNLPVFDFATGTSVTVVALYGGNAALPPERRRTTTLGIALRPFPKRQFHIRAEYVTARADNLTVTPVSGSRAFEAVFPGRFVRNAARRLTQIDLRPLANAREDERRLRISIDSWTELGPAPPPPAGEPDPAAPPPPPPKPRPSIYAMASATFRLSNQLTLVPGQPRLDLLDGATLDGNGGRPRWEVDGTVGFNRGAVATGVYARLQGGTRVRSDLAAADLRFSGRTWLHLFASLDAEKTVGRRWARQLSMNLTVENLLNDRIDVTDRTGTTPQRYQPGFMDPIGRSIRIGVRKLF